MVPLQHNIRAPQAAPVERLPCIASSKTLSVAVPLFAVAAGGLTHAADAAQAGSPRIQQADPHRRAVSGRWIHRRARPACSARRSARQLGPAGDRGEPPRCKRQYRCKLCRQVVRRMATRCSWAPPPRWPPIRACTRQLPLRSADATSRRSSWLPRWPAWWSSNPSVPVKTMQELTAYLKAHPGTSYASSGNGTPAHLGGELYKQHGWRADEPCALQGRRSCPDRPDRRTDLADVRDPARGNAAS